MEYGKITMALAIITVCIIIVFGAAGAYIVYAMTTVSIDPDELYPVAEVLDGDTFKANIGRHEVIVRMLGIDTPETVDPRKPVQCYGKEASNETKHVLASTTVRLKLNPNREEKDRYGRYLAYAYLPSGLFLNEYLLENGFAREYTYGTPYMLQKEFRAIEKEAQEGRKGLWGICPTAEVKVKK